MKVIEKIHKWCADNQATFSNPGGALLVKLNDDRVFDFNKSNTIGLMYRFRGNGPPGEYMTKKAALGSILRRIEQGVIEPERLKGAGK